MEPITPLNCAALLSTDQIDCIKNEFGITKLFKIWGNRSDPEILEWMTATKLDRGVGN